MRIAAVVLVVAACKSSNEPAHTTTSSTASGSAPAAPADAAAPPAKAQIVFVKEDVSQGGLAVPFAGEIPTLPASNAAGTEIADFESDAPGPMPVWPVSLAIHPLDGTAGDRIEIVTEPEATKLSESPDDPSKNAAMLTTIHERAKAAIARLTSGGFSSLTELVVGGDGTSKIGDLTLSTGDDAPITLANKQGEVVRQTIIPAYDHGRWETGMTDEPTMSCHYTPWVRGRYVDVANKHAFVSVAFRTHELCDLAAPLYVVFDLAQAAAGHGDLEAIRALIGADHGSDLAIALSRDGNSAWASSALADSRRSDVFVKTAAGWQSAMTARSAGVADATVNAEAKAGKRPVAPAAPADGDARLREAFDSLLVNGVDPVARVNPRLVAIGSAPKEHTIGGATLAAGWDAAWKGKVKAASVVARTTPSGTTGWVTAKVGVHKPGYVVPFTLTCIFDKQDDGSWSLVHIQFAV